MRPRSLRTTTLLLGSALASVGLWSCGGAPAPGPPLTAATTPIPAASAARSDTASCTPNFATPAPGPEPVAPLALADSVVALQIDVATSRLLAALESQVPVVLDQARRKPIGAAGKATYKVTRGALGLGATRDELLITAPIHIDLEVCKPLGPICVSYARCSPELLATTQVPLQLQAGLRLDPPRVRTKVVRSCTVLGVDLRDEIERRASTEARKVERQLAAHTPEIATSLEFVWSAMSSRFTLAKLCLKSQPRGWQYLFPELESDRLSLGVAITTQFVPCDAVAPEPRSLTAPELSRTTPATALHLPYLVSWDALRQALQRELGQAPSADYDVAASQFRAVETPAGARVHWRLPLKGQLCGTAVYQFNVSTTGQALRLTEIELVAPDKTNVFASDARFDALSGALARLRLSLEEPSAAALRELRKMLANADSMLDAALRQAHVQARVAEHLSAPRLGSSLVSKDGVVVDLHSTGTIALEVR